MSRVLTFSRVFPSYHHKAGEPTYFVEKMWNSLHWDTDGMDDELGELLNEYCIDNPSNCKHHTIRAGNRWKVGDKFSPRVWSGKPYNSKMITIAPDIEVKKTWDFEVNNECLFLIDKQLYAYSSSIEPLDKLAENDGLLQGDLLGWFKYPKPTGPMQIICWNENINY